MEEVIRAAALSLAEKWDKIDYDEEGSEPERLTELIQEVFVNFDFSEKKSKDLKIQTKVILSSEGTEREPLADRLTQVFRESKVASPPRSIGSLFSFPKKQFNSRIDNISEDFFVDEIASVLKDLSPTQIRIYKEVSKGLEGGGKFDLVKEIAKLPGDHPEERAKLCRDLCKGSDPSVRSFIVKVLAQMPGRGFEHRAKFCRDILKGSSGLGKFGILKEVVEIPGENLEERIKLFKKLRKAMPDHPSTNLIRDISKIPEGHFNERMELYRELKKESSLSDLVIIELISTLPEENFEERIGLYRKLKAGSSAQKHDLINAITKFSGNHIRERTELYVRLGQEMNLEQRGLLQNQLCDFGSIRGGESLKELEERFVEYLEEGIDENIAVQNFVFAFRERRVDWMPEELVSMAVMLHRQGDPYQSSMGEVSIRADRKQIIENPEKELKKLMSVWKSSSSKKLHLRVTFQDDKGNYESGIDAGGLSREYLHLLFKGLCDKYHLRELVLRGDKEDQQKEILKDLGKLFMACFHSDEGAGHFSSRLLMGCEFPSEIFTAVSQLSAKDCERDIEEVPTEIRLGITKLLSQNRRKEGEKLSPSEKLIFKEKEAISPEDQESLIRTFELSRGIDDESMDSLDKEDSEDYENLKMAFSEFLSDKKNDEKHKNLMKVTMDIFIPKHLEFVQALAKGMMNNCGPTRQEHGRKYWDSEVRRISPNELSQSIQGVIDRLIIAKAIACNDRSEDLQKKAGFLKEWVKDASEENVKKFLQILTGSTGLAEREKIIVSKCTEEDVTCEFHTCAYQLDFRPDFWELQFLDPPPRLATDEDKKRAFIQQFEQEIQSNTGRFTSA
jgi:hypothetical protein